MKVSTLKDYEEIMGIAKMYIRKQKCIKKSKKKSGNRIDIIKI